MRGYLSILMQKLVEFVTSRKMASEHPVVRALLAHRLPQEVFSGDHPSIWRWKWQGFARLIEAGILFQGDYNVHGFYGLSNFFYRNEGDYKVLLQECREGHPFNVSPFVSLGVRGFASELAGINNFIKPKVNRVIYRQ